MMQDERRQERGQLRRDRQPADEVEPLQHRPLPGQAATRQAEPRQHEATVGDEHAWQRLERRSRRWQRMHRRREKEQQQEQRDVAHELDDRAGYPAHRRRRRESQDTQNEAERGGEDPSEYGNAGRVHEPHDDRANKRVGWGVRDRRVADLEVCRLLQEPEAERDAVLVERGGGVTAEPPERGGRDSEREPLSRGGPALHRKGGAYINPPSVHSAFMPRVIPSGVAGPRLRSKIS